MDDNETNLRILGLQLAGRGLTPTKARSAAEALALLEQRNFAAIITDFQMPEVDGVGLARAIRERRTRDGTPVILLSSGFGAENDPGNLFHAQLSKPVKPAQLLAAILRAIAPEAGRTRAAEAEQLPMRRLGDRFPMTVLVAEDNVVNQKVIRQLLLRMGYKPEIVANGEEAIGAVRTGRFQLVLMDIQMPVMDGVEAMRLIRALAIAQPQIVAVTANALSDDRNRLLAAGFDDYISKPIPPRRLEEMIERQGRLLTSLAGAA